MEKKKNGLSLSSDLTLWWPFLKCSIFLNKFARYMQNSEDRQTFKIKSCDALYQMWSKCHWHLHHPSRMLLADYVKTKISKSFELGNQLQDTYAMILCTGYFGTVMHNKVSNLNNCLLIYENCKELRIEIQFLQIIAYRYTILCSFPITFLVWWRRFDLILHL